MSSILEREQEDIVGRLSADPYFADIPVLLQRKGVTDSDIESALGGLNSKGGKLGACVIVIMPSLVSGERDSSGPEYSVQHSIQVIEQPLFSNDPVAGVGKSAELIAEKVRQLLHYFKGPGGTLTFTTMEPFEAAAGKISYAVDFRHLQCDNSYDRCGLPLIDPDAGAVPQTVALSTGTAGAAIYFTTDGSYPSSVNPAAVLYVSPVEIVTACSLRAAAEKAGMQQSGISEATFI